MKLISIGQFWEFADRTGGLFVCWPWTGPVGKNGYGSFKGHLVAHRVAYELSNGPIPVGMTIDHTCHNNTGCTLSRACPHRRCCNPSHLEPVTNHENILRGEAPSAIHARKTHCPQGHEYTPENTYSRHGRNERECRECIRARAKKLSQDRVESGYNFTPEHQAYMRAYREAHPQRHDPVARRAYYLDHKK